MGSNIKKVCEWMVHASCGSFLVISGVMMLFFWGLSLSSGTVLSSITAITLGG